jgi:hypothetical protein
MLKTLALLLAFALPVRSASLTPQPVVTSTGLAALTFAETGARSWIINYGGGSPGGGFFAFADYGGTHYNVPTAATLNGQTISQTYVWGTANITYTVLSDNTLDIRGSVTNNTAGPLPNVELQLGKIAFPGNAPLEFYQFGNSVTCTLDPGFLAMNGSGAGINCFFTFSDVSGWPGSIHAGAPNWGNNALYANQTTLAPGQTLAFDFHANFFTTSAEADAVFAATATQFGTMFPQISHADDIRPVGQIFFVTGTGANGWSANNTLWATNPRGWLGDPTINVFTPTGLAAFKQRMVAFCSQITHNAASLPIRGFILWDVEGEQYSAATYVGHPSWLPQVAPEMDAIINDLIKIFVNAGYQVGFTLRQQMLVANPGDPAVAFYNTNWPQGADSPQAESDLDSQVRYCQARFGPQAKLYYVDSNPGREINTYRQLSSAHSDCLFAPECNFVVTRMYSECVPYQTGRGLSGTRNSLSTEARFVAAYPQAQSLINLADVTDTTANEQRVAGAMVRGDIPMIRIWWLGPEYTLLQKTVPVAQSQGWTGHRKFVVHQ